MFVGSESEVEEVVGKQILMRENVVSQTSASPGHLIWVKKDDTRNHCFLEELLDLSYQCSRKHFPLH